MVENPQDINAESVCKAVLKSSTRITSESTDEVRHLVLHVDEPAFRYREGQTIGVLVPGPHAFGNESHHRRYSIANARGVSEDEGVDIEILVRRCFYTDAVSGEQYPGVASNYLCDAKPGAEIQITGPYRSPFKIPPDQTANLLMIGTGTGVAPFRSFVQSIYRERGGWKGKVRLFYGAKTGMDLLYMNDENQDIAQYYDETSFKAFNAVSGSRFGSSSDSLRQALQDNVKEASNLMRQPDTYVFLSGQEKTADALDKVMAEEFGSAEQWAEFKLSMVRQGRWTELLYH